MPNDHNESTDIKIARLEEKTESHKNEIEALKKDKKESFDGVNKMFDKYVTKTEFWPVKVLVLGFAGLIFSGIATAIIALVLGSK